MLGKQQDRGTGRDDSLGPGMLGDFADVASSRSTAVPCRAWSIGQAWPMATTRPRAPRGGGWLAAAGLPWAVNLGKSGCVARRSR